MHILMLSNFSHRRRIVFCLTVYLENAWRNIGITKQLQVMDVNCGFASNNQGERMIQMQLWLHIFQLSRPPCERRIRYRPFIIVLKVINTCVVERNKKDFSLFFSSVWIYLFSQYLNYLFIFQRWKSSCKKMNWNVYGFDSGRIFAKWKPTEGSKTSKGVERGSQRRSMQSGWHYWLRLKWLCPTN